MLFSPHDLSTLALILAIALALNLLLGGPASLYQPLRAVHPLQLWHGLIVFLERKLNRTKRSQKTRRKRGLLLLIIGISLLLSFSIALETLFHLPYGEYAEAVLLTLLLGARPALDATTAMRKLLKKSPKQIAGLLLPSALTRREQKEYDHPAVLRAAIEWLALSFSESVMAPALYYLLFGWTGVLLALGLTVMDRLVGYRSDRAREFGAPTAILHSLLQWLPSRMAAFWLAFCTLFAPATAPLKAWRVMFAQAANTKSANAGWPLGAMAGALSITLGGPRALHGSYIADGWIGTGTSQPQLADLKRARLLFIIANLLMLMALTFIAALNL